MTPPPIRPIEPERGQRRDLVVRWLAYALVLALTVIDGLTPAGIVVGILLTIPVLLSSIGDEPSDVLLVSASALVGFIVAAVFGRGAISPAAVWIPNRIFVTIAILASCPLALVLQRRRLEAEAARARAERARDVSQLLQSLMAHDLRAPLAMAAEALQVAGGALPDSPESALLQEVELRLERSLVSVDRVLGAARATLDDSGGTAVVPADPVASAAPARAPVTSSAVAGDTRPSEIDVALMLRELVGRFEEDARAHGKSLELELPQRALGRLAVDAAVFSQVLSILLENAVQHADPGPVRVTASATARVLRVSVADSGPGYSQRRARPATNGGAGLGLKLSRLLAAKAGGTLSLARDDPGGSDFVLRLPIHALQTRRRRPRFLARRAHRS